MKKTILSILTVVTICISTTANNQNISSAKEIKVVEPSCHSLASAMASLSTVYGANYHSTYFAVMNQCISTRYN